MNIGKLNDLLDRHGADLEAWPPALRQQTEQFLAQSYEARATLARAQQIHRWVAQMHVPSPPALETILDRAMALPQQRPSQPAAGRSSPTGLLFTRWSAVAFSACLLVGLCLGAITGTASSARASDYASTLTSSMADTADEDDINE